ncbi:hypothetical protein Tco_0584650, partial [Tanacetum coccineum]
VFKTLELTSGSAQGGFNLNNEASGYEEEIREERSIGPNDIHTVVQVVKQCGTVCKS